ncbi:MAG: YheU family protein [Myxococcales bacterium]|nr:YheU family protein [Myxococcales bacterium]
MIDIDEREPDELDGDATDPGIALPDEASSFDEERTDVGDRDGGDRDAGDRDEAGSTLIDEEPPKLVIPWEQLSPDALQGVIEELVTREGTEYGDRDVDLDEKIAAVRRQLARGEVFVVFDAANQTTNIVTKRALRELGVEE